MVKTWIRTTPATSIVKFCSIVAIVIGYTISHAAEISLQEKAQDEGKLVAYLAMNAADAVTVQNSFEKRFPQIKVELVRMGAPSLLQRVLADVVLGFGFVHYELVQQRLLAR